MYPQPQLARLSARKCELRARIAQNRALCAAAAEDVTRPLRWLDQLLALWRELAPLAMAAAVPLGLLAHQRWAPRLKTLRSILHWAPLALTLFRGLRRKSA